MRSAIIVGAALALMATAAGAAQRPDLPEANGAIYSSDNPQPGVAVTGRRSFAQREAQSRIEHDLLGAFVIMAIAQRARHID
jgi:hypothetical protein